MIIVCEGMDNSGKTTLAQTLAKELLAVYIKCERPLDAGRTPMAAYRRMLSNAEGYSKYVILDRSPVISEPIYGTVIRGEHRLSPIDVKLGLDQIDFVIYCRPPTPVIMGSINDRDQMPGVLSNLDALISAYDRFFGTSCPIHDHKRAMYNYLDDDSETLIKDIKGAVHS